MINKISVKLVLKGDPVLMNASFTKIILFTITLGFSIVFAHGLEKKTFEKYFTKAELDLIEKAESIQKKYNYKVLVIKQIKSSSEALVRADDGKDYFLKGAKLSTFIDGSKYKGYFTPGDPVKYITVINSTRTIGSYIEMSDEEKEILTKAVPIQKKIKLIKEELRRVKGEELFKKNELLIASYIDLIEPFIDLTKNSKSVPIIAFREKNQLVLDQLKKSKVKQEYHGEELTEEGKTKLQKDINLMTLMYTREQKDISNNEKLAKMRKEKEELKLIQKQKEEERESKLKYEKWLQKVKLYAALQKKSNFLNDVNFLDKVNKAFPNDKGKKYSKFIVFNSFLGTYFRLPESLRNLNNIPKECNMESLNTVLDDLKYIYPSEYEDAKKEITADKTPISK